MIFIQILSKQHQRDVIQSKILLIVQEKPVYFAITEHMRLTHCFSPIFFLPCGFKRRGCYAFKFIDFSCLAFLEPSDKPTTQVRRVTIHRVLFTSPLQSYAMLSVVTQIKTPEVFEDGFSAHAPTARTQVIVKIGQSEQWARRLWRPNAYSGPCAFGVQVTRVRFKKYNGYVTGWMIHFSILCCALCIYTS